MSAERRLTLTMEQEKAIHALCTAAESSCWVLKYGENEEVRAAAYARLEKAWMRVSGDIMP